MHSKIRAGMSITILVMLLILGTGTSVFSLSSAEWSEPSNLSGWQEDSIWSSLSLNQAADGTLAAFWMRNNSDNEWSLWVRLRSPSAEWGPAENLSGWIKHESSGLVIGPTWKVAVTQPGTFWAAWLEDASTPGTPNVAVRAVYKNPDSPWQHDDPLVNDDSFIGDLDLAFGSDGQGLVVWTDCTEHPAMGGLCQVRARRRQAAAAAWGSIERLDDPLADNSIHFAQALAGPQGNFVVLWDELNPSTDTKAFMARAFNQPPGAWDTLPTKISAGWEEFVPARGAIDPGGTVTTGFVANTSPLKATVFAITRSAQEGTWSLPVPISTQSDGLYGLTFGAGQNGTTAAAWVQLSNSSSTDWAVYANSRDPGGVWQAEPAQVSAWCNYVGNMAFRIWPQGGTLLVWSQVDESRPTDAHEAVFYSVRPPAGNWGAGGAGNLSGWYGGIFTLGSLQAALDGSAGVLWTVTDVNRPIDQQEAVFGAYWPPDGPWQAPERISDWQLYVSINSRNSLVLGEAGRPMVALWAATRLEEPNNAVFISASGLMERQALIPLVLSQP